MEKYITTKKQRKHYTAHLNRSRVGRPREVTGPLAWALDAQEPRLTVLEAMQFLGCKEVWVRRKYAPYLAAAPGRPKRLPQRLLECQY